MKTYIPLIILIIVLCAVGYFVSSNQTTIGSLNNDIVEKENLIKEINNDWYYTLTDSMVTDAMKDGLNYDYKSVGNFEKKYSLPVLNNKLVTLKNDPPDAFLRTPYFDIVEKSYKYAQASEIFDFDTAKNMSVKGIIKITFFLYNNSEYFPQKFNAILKQDDVSIQPAVKMSERLSKPEKIDSINDREDRYLMEISNVYSVNNTFDLTKPYELLLMFNGENDSISYKVNSELYK